jgi:hypothetical protein
MSTAVKNLRDVKRKLVTSLDQIPDHFDSYEEEAEWWETHDLSEDVIETGPKVRAEFYQHLGLPDPAKRKK